MSRGRVLIGVLSAALAGAGVVLAPAGVAVVAARAATASTAGVPLYAFNTGLVFSVRGKVARGAEVRVSPDSGAASQRWVTVGQTLRPAADQHLCLNVPGARYSGGVKLQLWTCVSNASERFSTAAPSASTQVFFLRPAARTGYCLTSLTAPPNESGALVGLETCRAQTTQAWSHANLDGLTGSIGDEFGIQALQPATAGSAVTAGDTFDNPLDWYWVSHYTGATQASPVQLQPVEDTSLCASLSAAEAAGVTLKLEPCTATAASQKFSGVLVGPRLTTQWWTYLTTADSEYCVQAAASGSETARPVVLGSCVGNGRDFWLTGVPVSTETSGQFQEISAGDGSSGLSLAAAGSAGAGSPVVLSFQAEAASQVWTDLAPGQTSTSPGPGDSTSFRLFSDQNLCLTVPGADYSSGVQLTVATCDGAADQNFTVSFLPGNEIALVAAGDTSYCATASGGLIAGSAVELQQCAQLSDQGWSTFDGWEG